LANTSVRYRGEKNIVYKNSSVVGCTRHRIQSGPILAPKSASSRPVTIINSRNLYENCGTVTEIEFATECMVLSVHSELQIHISIEATNYLNTNIKASTQKERCIHLALQEQQSSKAVF
jgi:hypothetical protein